MRNFFLKTLRCVFLLISVLVFSFSVKANHEKDKSYVSNNPAFIEVGRDIYSLRFKSAERKIDEYIKLNPRDPYGYLMRGILYDWQQMILGKYGAYDKKVFNEFNKARSLAQVAYDYDRNDIQKKITLAHSLMYVSKKMIDLDEKFRAGGYLKRARDIMMYVKIHHPENSDIFLPLGVFYYYSANVPASMKWLASLLGFHGDRALGLSYMRKASQTATFNQIDAKYLLGFTLYDREKSFSEAETVLKDLMRSFPQNPEFRYAYARSAFKQKENEIAVERFLSFQKFCQQSHCSKQYLFLSDYYLASTYYKLKNYNSSFDHSLAAMKNLPSKEKKKKIDLHFKLAHLYHVKKNKKEACDQVNKLENYKKEESFLWESAQKKFKYCFEKAS